MKQLLGTFLIGLAALTAACTPATQDSDPQLTGEVQSPVDSEQESTEPPPALLTISGQEQQAGIGTYCWDSGDGVGVCADMIGVPTEPEAIVAGPTFLAEFDLPIDGNPNELSLSIFPVSESDAIPGERRNWLWWPYQPGDQYSLPLIQEPQIELTLRSGLYVFNLFARWPAYGDVSYGFLVEVSEALAMDAAAFAEHLGIPLEEAMVRLRHQETIGSIQPALMADLAGSFGGLWVEHEPVYRIVIALTEGDEATIQPYIQDKDWAEFVELRIVAYTLEELETAQSEAGRAASNLNVTATTAVDVMNNRVEVMVGNPDLFRADLAAAGIVLPEAVEITPALPDRELPGTNRGVLLEATAPDGRTIYLPKQAPSGVSMAALMEGTLVEVDGCLRLTDNSYPNGFLIIWPYDSDIRVSDDRIEVINGEGQPVARVGQPLRAGGGAIENSRGMDSLDEVIPGMPIDGCEGPYWVSADLETLVEQLVPDIYFEPFSSDDQTSVLYAAASRPSPETEILSGELRLDGDNCLRLDAYFLILPPETYFRENPLRLAGQGVEGEPRIGDQIQVSGAEKEPGDYRYFENKVTCPGPYWGANTITVLPG